MKDEYVQKKILRRSWRTCAAWMYVFLIQEGLINYQFNATLAVCIRYNYCSIALYLKLYVYGWYAICQWFDTRRERKYHTWKHSSQKHPLLTHLPHDKMAAILEDDISKCIFLNEIRISLKFVPMGSFDKKSALVQVKAEQATSHYRHQCWPSEPTEINHTMERLVNTHPIIYLICHAVITINGYLWLPHATHHA